MGFEGAGLVGSLVTALVGAVILLFVVGTLTIIQFRYIERRVQY